MIRNSTTLILAIAMAFLCTYCTYHLLLVRNTCPLRDGPCVTSH